jgi:hypothetical protein
VKRNYSCSLCKTKFSRRWNASRHNNTVHNGVSVIFDNETRIIMDNKDPYGENVTAKSDVKEDETNEHMILDIVGKMLQPFEELENLYSHKSEHEKIKNLSELIVDALGTSNPINSLNNTIDYHRSWSAKKKFASYISKYMNFSSAQADHYLTELIKKNKLYKNHVKYKRQDNH